MYYATAGQQAIQSTNPGTRGMSMGPSGFPPIAGAGLSRGGPPGFASRGADPNDFPALGSSLHPPHQQQSSQPSPTAQPGQHQQLYHPGQAPPPPPPGMSGPAGGQQQGVGGAGSGASSGGAATGTSVNGMLEQLRGEEFPALGADKDRMANYLRTQPSPPSGQASLVNGASSHSVSPMGQAPHPGPEGWAQSQAQAQAQRQGQGQGQRQHSPIATSAPAPSDPVTRPIQQILSSPVDKWGLKALLYEIKTQMGKSDRGMLMFGEELSELGVDVTSDEPLYRTFVTPWQDSHQIHSTRIQDPFTIPQHYQFPPPNMAPKMVNLSEDTLFIAFYASPQDTVQVESAAELYNRGWRYHTELQLWLTAPSLAGVEGTDPSQAQQGSPRWTRGPFVYFDPRTFTRDRMPEDYMINLNLIEQTRPAAIVIGEARARASGNGNANGQRGEEAGGELPNGTGSGTASGQPQAQGQGQGQGQGIQAR